MTDYRQKLGEQYVAWLRGALETVAEAEEHGLEGTRLDYAQEAARLFKENLELKTNQQAAIDAALESVADLLDSGDDWNTGDEIAEFIRSRIGTNPLAERAAEYARGIEFRVGQLAEAQSKIKELNGLCLYHEGLERELQAKIAELERELAETRKDAERWKCARIDPRVAAIYCQSSMAPAFKVDKAIDAAMRQEGE